MIMAALIGSCSGQLIIVCTLWLCDGYMFNTYYKPIPYFDGILRCIAHGCRIHILWYM